MPLDINMLENIILWVLRFVYMIYNRTIDLKNESKTAHDEINTLKTEIEALKKQNEKFKMEVVLLESRTWSQKGRCEGLEEEMAEELREDRSGSRRPHAHQVVHQGKLEGGRQGEIERGAHLPIYPFISPYIGVMTPVGLFQNPFVELTQLKKKTPPSTSMLTFLVEKELKSPF